MPVSRRTVQKAVKDVEPRVMPLPARAIAMPTAVSTRYEVHRPSTDTLTEPSSMPAFSAAPIQPICGLLNPYSSASAPRMSGSPRYTPYAATHAHMHAPTATGLSRPRSAGGAAEISELPLQLQANGAWTGHEQLGAALELRPFGNQVADDTQLVEHIARRQRELPWPLVDTGAQVQQSVGAQRPALRRCDIVEALPRARVFVLRTQESRPLSQRNHVLRGSGS